MFKQSTKDTINGWGMVFRFVTPLMLTIALWVINDVKAEIKEVKVTAKDLTAYTTIYNNNHLFHHASIEKEICERLARIEARFK